MGQFDPEAFPYVKSWTDTKWKCVSDAYCFYDWFYCLDWFWLTCQGKNEIFQTRHCCIRFSSRRLKDETITQGNEWMDGSIKRFNPNHDISLNLTKLFCARPNLNLVLSCHSDGQGLILSIDLEDLLQHTVSLCHFSTVYAVLPKRSYTFLFLENVTAFETQIYLQI